ncbi:MAG: ECF-type sigma factor, partial [Lysobacterales bacterium]
MGAGRPCAEGRRSAPCADHARLGRGPFRPDACSKVVSQHITRLLQQASEGDRAAFDALMPLVYEPLRRIARGQIASDARGH